MSKYGVMVMGPAGAGKVSTPKSTPFFRSVTRSPCGIQNRRPISSSFRYAGRSAGYTPQKCHPKANIPSASGSPPSAPPS